MNTQQAALSILQGIRSAYNVTSGQACVFKVFYGTDDTLYAYKDKDSPFISKWIINLRGETLKEQAYQLIVANSGSDLKCARLSKKATGWRYRFPDNCISPTNAIDNVIARIKKQKTYWGQDTEYTQQPVSMLTPVDVVNVQRERTNMNDFSLTNLKNALVNKVTSLDKKTVTILSIIALVLLVFCKYKDIKDILNGIKDKIKSSDNFKEMVADGTSAVNSLKKIVGVKGDK